MDRFLESAGAALQKRNSDLVGPIEIQELADKLIKKYEKERKLVDRKFPSLKKTEKEVYLEFLNLAERLLTKNKSEED